MYSTYALHVIIQVPRLCSRHMFHDIARLTRSCESSHTYVAGTRLPLLFRLFNCSHSLKCFKTPLHRSCRPCPPTVLLPQTLPLLSFSFCAFNALLQPDVDIVNAPNALASLASAVFADTVNLAASLTSSLPAVSVVGSITLPLAIINASDAVPFVGIAAERMEREPQSVCSHIAITLGMISLALLYFSGL